MCTCVASLPLFIRTPVTLVTAPPLGPYLTFITSLREGFIFPYSHIGDWGFSMYISRGTHQFIIPTPCTFLCGVHVTCSLWKVLSKYTRVPSPEFCACGCLSGASSQELTLRLGGKDWFAGQGCCWSYKAKGIGEGSQDAGSPEMGLDMVWIWKVVGRGRISRKVAWGEQCL